MNETLEFVRTLIYLFLSIFVLDLAIIVRVARLALLAIAGQFFLRGLLLFYQVVYPMEYRELNNWVGTPSITIVLLCVALNLWIIRRD
jgi:hypothetical protein